MRLFAKFYLERRLQRRLQPWRVSTLVLLLALSLIVLSSAAFFFIGKIASQEADTQAIRNDIRLFTNALRDRQNLMAREQLGLARWSKSFSNVSVKFNKTYIRDELVDWLWSDYGHDMSFIIDPEQNVRMQAKEDAADFTRRPLTKGEPLQIITARTVARYMTNRIPVEGGFRQKHVPARQAESISEFGYATIAGEPSLLSAMAIVPDDEDGLTLNDKPPFILVSVKFIRATFLGELNAQLGFNHFAFEQAGEAASGPNAIKSLDGSLLGQFTWQSERPGVKIWMIIVPVIMLLGLALTLAALLIVRRIGEIATRLESSEARNRQLALHDTLTGLANRLNFNQALESAVTALPGKPFAVIACDLDRFKAVNDTFGHAGGDLMIRTAAERLAASIGAAGIAARTGGDEFIILVKDFVDLPRLTILSRQIIASVCAPVKMDDGRVTDVGISLGIAIAPESGTTAEAVMSAADAALYAAKERGRGIAVFANSLQAEADSSQAADMTPDARNLRADAA